jgi:LPXTG-motif cell wall-anchored protein
MIVRRLVAMLAVVAVLVVGAAGSAFALPSKLRNSLLDEHRTDDRARTAVRQGAQPPPPPPRAQPPTLPHTGPDVPLPASGWVGLGLLGLGGGGLVALRRVRSGPRLRWAAQRRLNPGPWVVRSPTDAPFLDEGGSIVNIGAPALLAVVIVLAAAAPAAADASVSMGDNFYDPSTVTVTAGETVTWTHTGELPHTVTADDGSFDSSPNCPDQTNQCMQSGDSFSQTFNSEGNFGYFCKVHGQSMSGTVVVEAGGTGPAPGGDGGGEGDATGDDALPRTGPGPFGGIAALLGALVLLTGGLVLRVLGRRRRA